ncbi:MAG TPA: DUF6659 family protein [Candidatus Nitrosotalea sp.]|nr:DUF6659 family protein [Candidatus Nitrosotalea sp.]
MESGLDAIPNFERKIPSRETLESICEMILDLDPNIRFAGVINNKGRLLTGHTKKGIRAFTTQKDQEMLHMETALGMRMRKEHNSHLGPVIFTVSYGSKIISMNFPLDDEILCVSAEKKINLMTVPFLILKFLKANLDKKDVIVTKGCNK